jgi:hypothetical protein
MKENKYFLNTALAAVMGIAMTVMVLIRTFAPMVVLPRLNIPNMVLLSIIALLADHYVARNAPRCYLCIPIFAGLTFGLLPFAAGFSTGWDALKLGVIGCVVFTAATWLFTSLQDRLSTGPAAKTAPIFSALGLYLAAQCFSGILL